MPLARLAVPFDHADWIFEPKLDGFRALAYFEGGSARLVSRNGNRLKSFPALVSALGNAFADQPAVLDGEIVHLGPDGKPLFYELMRRRTLSISRLQGKSDGRQGRTGVSYRTGVSAIGSR